MKHTSVRSSLLAPLALGILVLAAAVLGGAYWNRSQQIDSLLEHRLTVTRAEFERIVAQESDLVLVGLEVLGGDRQLVDAFLRGDRDALLAHATPVFERLQSRYGISHLYFTDVDQVNFLRVHRPDLYGDRIDRYTTAQAVRTGEPFAGLELGRYRALLTLRGVLPWIADGRLIGYLELGKEIDALAARLGRLVDVDVAAYLYKDGLEREYWEAGMRAMGRQPDWDRLRELVRVDGSLDREPDDVQRIVANLPRSRDERFATRVGDRDLVGGFHGLDDAEGRRIGELVVLADITDVRAAANRLVTLVALASVAAVAALFLQLGRVDRRLRRAAKDKELLQENLIESQKMEAVGRLAGGVAHDFNNALTAITGLAELALASAPDERMADDLRGILEVSQGVARITGQLLAFARRQHLAASHVDLNEILGASSPLLKSLVGCDVEVTLDLEPRECFILMDPGQLDQVLLNLSVNARDAMTDGGWIELRTRVLDAAATARTGEDLPPGAFVELSISDNGCGMDAETQGRMFEPFFTTKEQGRGTGLGLATVYGVVAQYDGHIRVDSQPGRGTTLRLYFPLVEPVAESERSQPAQLPRPEQPRILLVDDEPAVLAVLKRMLELSGLDIVAADGASAAREAFRPGEFDLLITDVVMPDQRGDQLYTDLLRSDPSLRVLFMSGYSREADGRPLLTSDAPFISKPIDRSKLLRQIETLLA